MHRSTLAASVLLAAGLILTAQLTGCASPRGGRRPVAADAACPPWVEFPANPRSNRDLIHLGCANAANLRNMLADPEDLQHGQTLGPASGERESLGVGLYDKGKSGAAKDAGGAAPTIIMPAAGGSGNP